MPHFYDPLDDHISTPPSRTDGAVDDVIPGLHLRSASMPVPAASIPAQQNNQLLSTSSARHRRSSSSSSATAGGGVVTAANSKIVEPSADYDIGVPHVHSRVQLTALPSVTGEEEEDDACDFRIRTYERFLYPGWWKRRTLIERYLIIILLILCCLLGALGAALCIVAFANSSKGIVVPSVIIRPNVSEQICDAPGCITAAARILESIDTSVNPCDDFYEFACKGWSKTRVIPEDMSRYSVFTAIREALEVALKRVLEADESPDEPSSTRKAKRVYKACMNETAIDGRGEEPAVVMLKSLVGWPVILPETYNETAFDWQKSIARLRADGADLLISMGVWADSRNSSRYVIYVDQPGVGMPSTEYMLRGLDDKYVQGYYQYMLDVASLFNATNETVRRELKDVLEFEIELAKIKTPREERRNDTKMYNKMTIKELTQLIPSIRWKEYFDVVMPKELNVTENEEIVIKEPEFFIRLVELVNKTSKRVLANYLGWRTIQSVVWDLDVRFRNVLLKYKKILYGTLKDRERWRSCVQASANFFDMAVGRLYVKENFNGHSKAVAEEMIKDIRDAFDDILVELDWMDDEARLVAKEKAAAVKEKIGFPDFIMNITALDDFFNGTVADEFDHFSNVINNSRVWNTKFLMELRKPFDKERWSTGPAVVNAFYSTDNNAITFPAGILQPPFFSKDQPKSMNFGGIGMVIGHELTHGFDDQGRQKDKDGNLRQWWPTSTIEKFEKKAQCIIGQYGNFSVSEVNMTLNGVNTQGENIADNGGLKQAYRAYHKWLSRQTFDMEPRLPGLPYSNEQLFFINYAMVWCGIYRPDAYVNQILSGVHSPGKYRVIGPLTNSKEFAEAFSCPVGSPMNSPQKCRVW